MSSIRASNAVPLAQIAYAAASITATYTLAGTFSDSLIFGFIVSTLDQPVQISFDGLVDHMVVPAGSTVPVFMPLNFKDNLVVLTKRSIFVKEVGNPTTGSLYVCGFGATIP